MQGDIFLFPHNKRIRAVDSTICFFSSISAILKTCHRASALHLGSRELIHHSSFTLLGTYAPCWVVITNCRPQAILLKLYIYYTLWLHLPEEPNSYVCPIQECYFKIVGVQSPGSFDSFVVNPQTYFGVLLLPDKTQLKFHMSLREKK